MTALGKDWFILRCSGANTLKLAASLGEMGYDVWTPIEETSERKGKSRVRRRDTLPVMPTYVFANARHLHSLIAERELPVSQHPDFSVFHHNGRIPLIADKTLDPLRIAEREGTPIEKVARLNPGDFVRYPEAGFQGLSGEVMETKNKGKFALVAFGVLQVEIATFRLLPENQQPQAKAA